MNLPDRLETLLDAGKFSAAAAFKKNYKGRDGRILFLSGEAERGLGNFDAALKLYNSAAANADEAELRMEISLSAAACLRTLGRSEEAYYTAADVYKLAQTLEYGDYGISALQEIAMALRAWGKLDESLDALNEVLSYYTAQKDYGGVSFILWAKGGVFRLRGKFEEGVKAYKDAARYAVKSGNKINLAYAYCGLAGISRISGDVKACVKNYRLSDKIFRRTEDVFGKAYTNCGLANGLRQAGELKEALTRYKKADALYSKIGDRVDLGFVKWGMADVLKRRNNLRGALVYLKEAEKLFDGSDEKRGQLLTQLSLAQVLYALGHAEAAVEKFDAAVTRAKEEGLNTYLEIYT